MYMLKQSEKKIKNINPLISVVIVSYNGENWLTRCINCLLKQTYKNIEIIIVDNGSDDNSVDLVNNIFKEKVRLYESANNLGFASGNSYGISKASGEFILLFNQDAWVDKYFIERLFAEMIKKKLDVIAPQENDYEDKNRQVHTTTIDILGHPVKKTGAIPGKLFYLCGVSLLFSKKLYNESGGLDPDFFMYFEETDWFWRLQLLSKRFAYSEDIYIHHAGMNPSGKIIKYNIFLWRNQNCLQMLLKNYSFMSLLLIIPFYLLINIFEILVFILLGKFSISKSYVLGWIYNIKILDKTLTKRYIIQSNRKVSDIYIARKMYFGFGKISHLAERILNK